MKLQRGNYVYANYPTGKEVIEVESISKFFVNGIGISAIEPILLTEEFKTEFGKDKLVLVDKSGFVIFKNGYAYQFVFGDYPYIHQLQNLYFALTQTELTLS